MNRNRATSNYHHRGKVERMKYHPGNHTPALHHIQGKAKYIGPVTKIAFQLEVHPAKHKRESNQCREHAAPHDQKVHRPTRESPLEDESLTHEVGGEGLRSVRGVLHKLLSLQV